MDSLSPDSSKHKSSFTLTGDQIIIERHKVEIHLWRAKQVGNPATLTPEQWLEILDDYGWKCAYCPDGSYQVLEHLRPISAGGGTTAENCLPACRSCNNRKKSQTAIYDDAMKSFHFTSVPLSPMKERSPRQRGRSLSEAHKKAIGEALRQKRKRQKQDRLEDQKTPHDNVTQWLTQDQVLERLARVSLCKETHIEVIKHMVRSKILNKIFTAQGAIYCINKSH